MISEKVDLVAPMKAGAKKTVSGLFVWHRGSQAHEYLRGEGDYRQFHNSYKVNMVSHFEEMTDYYSKIAIQDSKLAAEHRILAQPGR